MASMASISMDCTTAIFKVPTKSHAGPGRFIGDSRMLYVHAPSPMLTVPCPFHQCLRHVHPQWRAHVAVPCMVFAIRCQRLQRRELRRHVLLRRCRPSSEMISRVLSDKRPAAVLGARRHMERNKVPPDTRRGETDEHRISSETQTVNTKVSCVSSYGDSKMPALSTRS